MSVFNRAECMLYDAFIAKRPEDTSGTNMGESGVMWSKVGVPNIYIYSNLIILAIYLYLLTNISKQEQYITSCSHTYKHILQLKLKQAAFIFN